MNIVNKIKLLEQFKRYSGAYYGDNLCALGSIIKEDELDSYQAITNEKEINFNFLRFLSVQAPENRTFIYNELKDCDYNKLIDLKLKHYPIVSKDNIEWIKLFLNTEISPLDSIKSFNDFLKATKDFKVDNGYELVKYLYEISNGQYVFTYDKLAQLLQNSNFNIFSFEDIYKVLLNSQSINNISVLDESTIRLYTDKVSTTFSDVNEDNFRFVKTIESLYGWEYVDSISIYLDKLLKHKESINEILNLLNDVECRQYCKMFINFFILAVDTNSEFLMKNFFDKVFMKISYGSRVNNIEDLFELGFDIKVNTAVNEYACTDGFNLAKIKSIGSKGLYNKVKNDLSLNKFVAKHVNFLTNISNVINLGQLNEHELKSLISALRIKYRNNSSLFVDIPYKLSFKEFEYVVKHANLLPKEIFEYVSELKIDARIKIFNILVSATTKKSELYSISNIMKEITANDLLKTHDTFGSKNIQAYIKLKMIESHIGFVIDNLDELNKISAYFDICGIEYFKGVTKSNIDTHFFNNDSIQTGLKQLNISSEFVCNNLSNTIDFIINGGFDIAISYFNNRYVKDLQRQNLTLIVKAILAGKYNDLKFNYSDIFKEIEINMPEDNFKNWAADHEMSNDIYTVKDAGDFNTIMTIGVKPVSSCMNYVRGSYSQCLLSNIDTAKKILTIYKNGTYVGRAILRLTKCSSTEAKRLAFVDVENESSDDIVNYDERLVLFVEKLYTSLDSKDLNAVYDLMIQFLQYKAKLLGARLMLSSQYYNRLAEMSSLTYTTEDTHIFITASKNGQQYLDSFDGSTSSACCYKKANVLLY